MNTVPNHPLQFLPWGPRRTFEDGSILKTTDDPRVYLTINDKKYPFESEGAFYAFGFSFAMVEDVEPSVMAKYTSKPLLSDVDDAPEGLAFKYAASPTVYLLTETDGDLTKSAVPTYDTLRQVYRADHLAVLPPSSVFPDAGTVVTPEPEPEPTPTPTPTPAPTPTPVPVPTPTPTSTPALAPGNYTYTFTLGGLERSYTLHVPTGYTGASMPLLMHLHGGTGSAAQGEISTGFSPIADREGFIVVYGQATAVGLLGLTTWNAGNCCGGAMVANVDDVGYAREVVRRVKEQVTIAPTRVYASGMSNGSMLANRLACEAADLFAGVATVSGTIQVNTCNPSRHIPVLIVHGTDDENVPYNGGNGEVGLTSATYIPVEQAFAQWSTRNSCQTPVITTAIPPTVADGTTADRLQNTSCPAGQEVVLYRINGGGHGWPGGTGANNALEAIQPSKAINTSETIVSFFSL